MILNNQIIQTISAIDIDMFYYYSLEKTGVSTHVYTIT